MNYLVLIPYTYMDYAEYLVWVAAGNSAEPYVAPVPTSINLLVKLDSDNMLTQRNLREFILLTVKAVQTLNPTLDLTQLPGIAKVVQVETEAAVLRAQI